MVPQGVHPLAISDTGKDRWVPTMVTGDRAMTNPTKGRNPKKTNIPIGMVGQLIGIMDMKGPAGLAIRVTP